MEIQRTLNQVMQEYQSQAVKYTDEHPTMQALKAKIDTLQKQMATETWNTGNGKTLFGGGQPRISDPVRSNLVQALATAETELQGLSAQRAALDNNLQGLKSRLEQMPEKQMHVADLMDTETLLSDMLRTLKQKAAEADIQASESLSNVITIEAAHVGPSADFPEPVHILFLMMCAGLMGGLSWLMMLEWMKMQALQPLRDQMDQPMAAQI